MVWSKNMVFKFYIFWYPATSFCLFFLLEKFHSTNIYIYVVLSLVCISILGGELCLEGSISNKFMSFSVVVFILAMLVIFPLPLSKIEMSIFGPLFSHILYILSRGKKRLFWFLKFLFFSLA